MYCDRCGAANRDEARFCRSCGTGLGPSDAESPTRELPVAASDPVPEDVRRALQDKYRVEKLLGRGGMGVVYLAREIALDRPVAVKLLQKDLAADARSVKRFLQEARIAARLRHPNIVSIHAVGESEGVTYFTMDFIDGSTLDAHVRGLGKIPAEEARAIVADVAAAIGHAHGCGVIHRDLKPGNVMLDGSGHPLVLDFGLAKARTHSLPSSSGLIAGTPQYISPEQIEGKPASPASDVYALGLIWYFMLAGRDPVQGDSVSAVVAQHLSSAPRTRAAEDKDLPASERPLLLSMIERDPARRPSVEALLGSLREAPRAAPAVEPAAEPLRNIPPVSPARRQARERMKTLLDRMPKRRE